MSSKTISVATLGLPKGRIKNECWAANSRQYSNTSSQNKHGMRPKYPLQTCVSFLPHSPPRQNSFSPYLCSVSLLNTLVLKEIVSPVIIILNMICLCHRTEAPPKQKCFHCCTHRTGGGTPNVGTSWVLNKRGGF